MYIKFFTRHADSFVKGPRDLVSEKSGLLDPNGSSAVYPESTESYWASVAFHNSGKVWQSRVVLLIVLILSLISYPLTLKAEILYQGEYAFSIISNLERLCALEYNDKQPYQGDFIIPESIEYDGEVYRVYQVNARAFESSYDPYEGHEVGKLTSLTIPPTLKVLKNPVFGDNIWSLKKLIIQESPDELALGTLSHHELGVSIKELYLGRNVSFEIWRRDNYNPGWPYGPFGYIEKVVMSDYVTKIPSYLFRGCSRTIKELVFSPNIIEIGEFSFINALSITSLTIPEHVVKIDNYAFSDNSSLQDVILPSCLEEIGSYAFGSSYRGWEENISVVLCHATVPPLASGTAFGKRSKSIRLRVPSEAVREYKEAETWKEFGDILSLDGVSSPYPNVVSLSCLFDNGSLIRENVRSGESKTLEFKAADGYVIHSVSVNGDEMDRLSGEYVSLQLESINEDTCIQVIYEEIGDSSIVQKRVSDIRIGIDCNIIKIFGNFNSAKLFSVAGECLYAGSADTIEISQKGLMILEVDSRRFKFMIF